MFKNFIPSQLLGRFVPQFAENRWGGHIQKTFSVADAIIAGEDEKAISLRTALIAFSIRMVSAFIAYISQILLARWLGSYEYGIFVWVWVAAVICGGLACLGFPSAVVRFIPQYRVKKDDAALRGVLLGSRLYSVLTATFIAAFGMVIVWLFPETVGHVYVLPVFLAVICLPMLALAEVQDGIARAFSWVDVALSPTYLLRPVLILVVMVILLSLGYDADAKTALVATIFATWFTSVTQMLILNRRLGKTVPSGPRSMQPKVWISIALPIFLVEGFFTLLTNVDILLVGMYLPPNEVAIYFAAVKTLALVHFVYFAVKAGAAHRYSQYFSAGDTPRFEAFVHDTVQWTFWPSLGMGIVLLIFGKFLLSLFGSEFTSGYPLMFILVIGIIFRASVGPAESVLNMAGQQNLCAAIYGITLLVNITLNIVLIPAFGLYGAAWATTFALIFETGALYSLTLRRLNLNMSVFRKKPEPVNSPSPSSSAETAGNQNGNI